MLSHADAERDEMHSFLLQTMTSVGLNRALILDKAQTVASITLLSNEHVTPTVRISYPTVRQLIQSD